MPKLSLLQSFNQDEPVTKVPIELRLRPAKNILFSIFHFKILILKDSIMNIFKYVIENIFSILNYPKFERFNHFQVCHWKPFIFHFKYLNFERFNHNHLQMCDWKHFIFNFGDFEHFVEYLKISEFWKTHDHFQLCHWQHLFSVFLF